jgi:hypothetical protein
LEYRQIQKTLFEATFDFTWHFLPVQICTFFSTRQSATFPFIRHIVMPKTCNWCLFIFSIETSKDRFLVKLNCFFMTTVLG